VISQRPPLPDVLDDRTHGRRLSASVVAVAALYVGILSTGLYHAATVSPRPKAEGTDVEIFVASPDKGSAEAAPGAGSARALAPPAKTRRAAPPRSSPTEPQVAETPPSAFDDTQSPSEVPLSVADPGLGLKDPQPGSGQGTDGSGAGKNTEGDGVGNRLERAGVPHGVQDLSFSDGMTEPTLISHVAPVYTREAIDADVSGTVLAKCVIKTDGMLERCRIIKGLPYMDQAVLRALSEFRYTPVTYQGKVVSVEYLIRLRLEAP
jgi:protein TonB